MTETVCVKGNFTSKVYQKGRFRTFFLESFDQKKNAFRVFGALNITKGPIGWLGGQTF